jgi:hypothetical protein
VAVGRDAVAGLLLHYVGPSSGTTLLSLPLGDHPGVVAVRGDQLVVAFAVTVREGRVVHIEGVVDPVKLEPLRAELGL